MKLYLIISISLSSIIFAQSNYFTDGYPNGRYWNNIGTEAKILYMYGIEDALSICRVYLTNEEEMTEIGLSLYEYYSAKNYTNHELIQAIDSIYNNIEYTLIPIRDVASIILERYSGKISENELQSKLRDCMEIYNK